MYQPNLYGAVFGGYQPSPMPSAGSMTGSMPGTTTTTSSGQRQAGMDPMLTMGLGRLGRKYGPGLLDQGMDLWNQYMYPTGPNASPGLPWDVGGTNDLGYLHPFDLGGGGAGSDVAIGAGADYGAGAGMDYAAAMGASPAADAASGAASAGSGMLGSLGTGVSGGLGTLAGGYTAGQLGYNGIGSQLGGMAGSAVGGYFGGPAGAAGGGFLGSLAGGIKQAGIEANPELGWLTIGDPVASSIFDLFTVFG